MTDRQQPPPPRHTGAGNSVWRTVGIVLAVLVALGGLAVVGFIVLFVVAMNSYGSNK